MLNKLHFLLVLFLFLLFSSTQSLAFEHPDLTDKYIVVFNDSVGNPERVVSEMALRHGLSVDHIYTHALHGFSATIPAPRLRQLKLDKRIRYISTDKEVSLFRPVGNGKPAPTNPPQPNQEFPLGILRLGSNIEAKKGTGIGVAVIDTGIDLDHPDLIENLAVGKTCVPRTKSADDDNGHGTHVAGTIAARNNSIGVVGVAPEAKLYPVKVLNARGSGTWSSVICGIDYVTSQKDFIQVANMSLGGAGQSDNNCGQTNNDALHQAICNSRDAGIIYVVAAGNESDNASLHVPAAYDDAVITVSALVDTDGKPYQEGSASSYGTDDTYASFSNYGPSVDIGAPGVGIYSTWKGGSYYTISGTSMATPHVAGAVALVRQSNPGLGLDLVRSALISAGEIVGFGHTDPSGIHPERVLQIQSL